MRPQPTEEEIGFILSAISEFLTVRVRRSDVLSAWYRIYTPSVNLVIFTNINKSMFYISPKVSYPSAICLQLCCRAATI